MTDHELERRLRTALDHAAPNDLEGVLSRCETGKGTVIDMTNAVETKKKKRRWAPLAAAACLALLLLQRQQRGGLSGVPGREPQHPAGSQ